MTDSNKYPICNVFTSWRSETDKQMQAVFCPLAQATDTNVVSRDYPDSVERFCNSCPRRYNSVTLGTKYNYQ